MGERVGDVSCWPAALPTCADTDADGVANDPFACKDGSKNVVSGSADAKPCNEDPCTQGECCGTTLSALGMVQTDGSPALPALHSMVAVAAAWALFCLQPALM